VEVYLFRLVTDCQYPDTGRTVLTILLLKLLQWTFSAILWPFWILFFQLAIMVSTQGLLNFITIKSFRSLADWLKHVGWLDVEYLNDIRHFSNCEKNLNDNNCNDPPLTLCDWIFVLGNNLFLEAPSVPPALHLENCSLLVCRQISKHIFAPNRRYCSYTTLKNFH